MFSAVAEDVQAIARDLGLPGRIIFSRLAVTPLQIDDLSLSTAPAKATDRRSFEGETTQAEAIPPDVLASIVADAIRDRLDGAAFDRVLDRERRACQTLTRRLKPLMDGWEGEP